MNISNTVGVRRFRHLTDGYVCAFAASSASARAAGDGVTVWIITAIRMPFSRSTGYLVWQQPMLVKVDLVTSNNQLESRMREIRQSGSVGGEGRLKSMSLPYPYRTRFRFCPMKTTSPHPRRRLVPGRYHRTVQAIPQANLRRRTLR